MDFLTLIQTFGWPIGTMVFVVVMLYTDQIVSGRRYREACRQRDRLLKLALAGQRKAWHATDIAAALVPPTDDGDSPDAD